MDIGNREAEVEEDLEDEAGEMVEDGEEGGEEAEIIIEMTMETLINIEMIIGEIEEMIDLTETEATEIETETEEVTGMIDGETMTEEIETTEIIEMTDHVIGTGPEKEIELDHMTMIEEIEPVADQRILIGVEMKITNHQQI